MPSGIPAFFCTMRHKPSDLTRWHLVVVLTSATIFVASLTQIAFVVDRINVHGRVEPLTSYGLELLIVGWLSVIEGRNLLIWPLVVAGWALACCKWRVAAVIAALVAGVLMLDYRDTGANAAWLANPIIAVTWILYLRDVRFAALISAATALGLTMCFLWVKYIPGPADGLNVPDFEMHPIISYGIGYWLWVASAAVLVAGMSADKTLFLRQQGRRPHF
jgi:hypothetical protein